MGRVNESIIPKDGWVYYQQIEGIEPMRIEGDGLDDLIRRVVQERLNRRIDVSNVAEEVEDAICERSSKSQCRPKPKDLRPGAVVRVRKITPLGSRIYDFIDKIHAVNGRPLVYDEIASRRADICRACPQNIAWHTSCAPCNSKIENILFMLRMGRETKSTRKIAGRACRALGICTRSAAFLDVEKMGLSFSGKAPAGCWVRKLGLTHED